MFPSRSSQRVDLSTELGFAVVEGMVLVCTAPGRFRRHVTGQVSGADAKTGVIRDILTRARAWRAGVMTLRR